MIRFIITATIGLVGLLCNAQVSENRAIAGFTKIEVSKGVQVFFTQGNTTTVKVESDNEDKLKQIVTAVKGETLKISVQSKKGSTNFQVLKVSVTAPNVSSFKIDSGAGFSSENTITVKKAVVDLASGAVFSGNIKATEAVLKLNSAATFKGNIETKDLGANLSGASTLKVTGKAENMKLETASSSFCKAKDLVVQNAVVKAESAAVVTVNVKNSLDVSANSTAVVKYYGTPKNISQQKATLGKISAE
ncbi:MULTISPECIES: head GIN domain-containing protein [unclassified Flavobacterium]|uniref:head GIN domain-containing protein n=1 Tax=unclassified Flavobacterium TaxID=196869 RepID=UPI00086B10F6|nr:MULTISPECIES: head GIN domain-containing protein [unclassified Flavobacterium]MBN9283594.1 DUF2807 domain-containing protein [Flavobacterium sp.]ODS82179.1 MAG: hypothetical protein ABS44_18530 [Chryseobacterium sp. SCN 40-13]OJV69297.1 MAG: hypothetical protein BGO42_13035 [Flavobacterium sp. 40-81]